MGMFDRFKKTTSPAYVPAPSYYGSWLLTNQEYERILGLSPAMMWRTQPYLRTVVTFLARNIAQLGLHTYQRVSDDDRQRIHDGIDSVLARPNLANTTYELVYGLVADLALYDVAYWLLSPDPAQPLSRIPPLWVEPIGGDAYGPKSYRAKANDQGETVDIPADQILEFHGWAPDATTLGSTPVVALKEILAEQVQAARYREMVWRRGGKVGAVLTRPPDAPEWAPEARKQFKEDWDAQFTGTGPNVGGTPLLEDGMSLTRVDFSAHEMEFIEGSRLALNTVASVYHVNPTMIGVLDNANYSNVREFRRMLYGDTLGPILAQIEGRLNTFLVPRLDPRPGIYVEFNIEEKLKGSFEEQTSAIQTAVGRPWMTADEARALRNMPALGGDAAELVTPLNVLVGGQASPTDSAPNAAAAADIARKANLFLLKARVTDRQSEQIASVLARFFKRQRDADRYAHGGTWEGERWDAELADDLHRVALSVSGTLGKAEARSLGYEEGDYAVEATVNFLETVTQRRAIAINETTKAQLDKALADEDADPGDVYDNAISSRSSGIAVGLGTFLAGFAASEVAKQLSARHNVEPTKTWVTGPNPRADHAALDGETVPYEDSFSNGLMWPGDGGSGDAAEVAGCNCTLQINL
jgi:HK97 family phage portal protein